MKKLFKKYGQEIYYTIIAAVLLGSFSLLMDNMKYDLRTDLTGIHEKDIKDFELLLQEERAIRRKLILHLINHGIKLPDELISFNSSNSSFENIAHNGDSLYYLTKDYTFFDYAKKIKVQIKMRGYFCHL